MIERVVAASPGGWDGPSARYRLGPLSRLELWPVEVVSAGSFPTADRVRELLDRGGRDALLVLQRVLPRPEELDRLRAAFANVVFDFDDAIYSTPPDLRTPRIRQLPKQAVRLLTRGSPRASARKRPLIGTLKRVDLCIAGNAILASFATRHARRVVEIPTTVQPVDAPPATRPAPAVLVWLGLPDNMQHLDLVRPALERLGRTTDFRLRIVSSRPWDRSPLPAEFVPWSLEASRDALVHASVGLAPLADDPWTRGKCAMRAIQYGGHGLPTVASPVGITERVVRHGETGFLAETVAEWASSLRLLLDDDELVEHMGAAALRHIRRTYSDDVAAALWRRAVESL